MPRQLLSLYALLLFTAPAVADVTPHSMFNHHMVLQRGETIPVWGTAEPSEAVEVRIVGDTESHAAAVQARQSGEWSAKLPCPKGEGPFKLEFKTKTNSVVFDDVLVGEVWICSGQSNMEWPLRQTFEPAPVIKSADHPKIRLFTEPHRTASKPQKEVQGKWSVCSPETVPTFSAVAYYFGRDLHKALNVPIGLIHSSWGGTPAEAWTSREALESEPKLQHYPKLTDAAVKNFNAEEAKAKHQEAVEKARAENKPAPRAPTDPDKSPGSASRLYNGMIAPIVPFAFRGVIWYQGESNAGRAYEYRTLFPAMIRDWRKQWGRGDFPFLLVQLAPFQKIVNEPGESAWAELREAQRFAAQALPNVGMAVITDVGEENDIHPKKKEPVGARLALLARAMAYGDTVESRGPEIKSMKPEAGRAVLTFDHVAGGLEARGGELTGFTICGPELKFLKAKAEIQGDTIVVSHPDVTKPVAVRFGWANYPVVNLWNKAGLPAGPFQVVWTGP